MVNRKQSYSRRILSQGKLDDTLSVLQFLQSYEDKFPIYILQWPEETLEIVKSSPWAQQRLISLTYKDKVFESISDLMGNPLNAKMLPISRIKKSAQTILFNTGEIFDFTDSSRPELTIATDYETFKKPRRDYHPSKLCHKVISDNIIWRLENDNIF